MLRGECRSATTIVSRNFEDALQLFSSQQRKLSRQTSCVLFGVVAGEKNRHVTPASSYHTHCFLFSSQEKGELWVEILLLLSLRFSKSGLFSCTLIHRLFRSLKFTRTVCPSCAQVHCPVAFDFLCVRHWAKLVGWNAFGRYIKNSSKAHQPQQLEPPVDP